MPLEPCPSCARHVRLEEAACPFCAVPLGEAFARTRPPRMVPAPGARLRRRAAFALGVTAAGVIGVSACSSTTDPSPTPSPTEAGTDAQVVDAAGLDVLAPLDAPREPPDAGATGADAGTEPADATIYLDDVVGIPIYGAAPLPL